MIHITVPYKAKMLLVGYQYTQYHSEGRLYLSLILVYQAKPLFRPTTFTYSLVWRVGKGRRTKKG